jgi:hypothetical protein
MKNNFSLAILITVVSLSHIYISANSTYYFADTNDFTKFLSIDILPESLYQFVGQPYTDLVKLLESYNYRLTNTEIRDDLTTKTGKKITSRSMTYEKNNHTIIIISRIPTGKMGKEFISHIESFSEYDNREMSKSEYDKINVRPHINQLELFGFKKTGRDEDYVFLSKGKSGLPGYIECQFSHGKFFYIEFSIED